MSYGTKHKLVSMLADATAENKHLKQRNEWLSDEIEGLNQKVAVRSGPAMSFESAVTSMAAASRGEKIHAIKVLRALTGCGLKEAKDAIESIVFWSPEAGG